MSISQLERPITSHTAPTGEQQHCACCPASLHDLARRLFMTTFEQKLAFIEALGQQLSALEEDSPAHAFGQRLIQDYAERAFEELQQWLWHA